MVVTGILAAPFASHAVGAAGLVEERGAPRAISATRPMSRVPGAESALDPLHLERVLRIGEVQFNEAAFRARDRATGAASGRQGSRLGNAQAVSVVSGSTFYLRVRGCNGAGCSGWRSRGPIQYSPTCS